MNITKLHTSHCSLAKTSRSSKLWSLPVILVGIGSLGKTSLQSPENFSHKEPCLKTVSFVLRTKINESRNQEHTNTMNQHNCQSSLNLFSPLERLNFVDLCSLIQSTRLQSNWPVRPDSINLKTPDSYIFKRHPNQLIPKRHLTL